MKKQLYTGCEYDKDFNKNYSFNSIDKLLRLLPNTEPVNISESGGSVAYAFTSMHRSYFLHDHSVLLTINYENVERIIKVEALGRESDIGEVEKLITPDCNKHQ